MNSVSADTLTQILTCMAILLGLVVVGVVVVQRFRGRSAGGGPATSELLTKFQEMHRAGEIDEKEYRTIKSVLGSELQRDVKQGKHKA